ncbi:MAG: T9SS type A sorting domain-containing protein, partial [bacterium]
FFFTFIITSLFLFTQSGSAIPLNGTYTIGTGGNYLTISSAVNDLVSLGVSGAVIFNIKTGSYDESVTINPIPGASSINNITFQSQTLNANDVNWYSSNTASSFTLKINGADFLTIKFISFPDNNSSVAMRSRILFSGSNDDIKILNNIFSGGITNDYGLLSSNALMNNLIIDRNSIDIKFGIYFPEQTLISRNTQITNNNLSCNNVIEIYRHEDMLIAGNSLNCTSLFGASPSPSCIRALNCNGNLRILKNKLISVSVNSAADGITVGGYEGLSALIANNFVSLRTGTGIWISDATNVNVYFNTVRTADQSSGDITFVSCTGINSKNNIMVNLGNFGSASLTYYLIESTFNSSDYNNFYYINQYILYHSVYGYLQNLAQYRTISGMDIHSIERAVSFASNTDLHLNGSSVGDAGLVGIPIPGITDDIDGQPRNPLHPYMGADESDIPLPVELISFTSTVNNSDVILNWTTSSEINNSGFEIDRSFVNGDWSMISFIKGHGNSNTPNDYSFTDTRLITGKYNYRLKQIDLNGNFKYFYLGNEVNIGVPQKFELSQNYPNPFNPKTIINYDLPIGNFVSLKIFDDQGKEVATLVNGNQNAGNYKVEFNGENFSSGIYYYKLETENLSEVRKMILLK